MTTESILNEENEEINKRREGLKEMEERYNSLDEK